MAAVTAELRPDWQADYDHTCALQWLRDREAESELLILHDRCDEQLLGLLGLFRGGPSDSGEEIRIGSLLPPAH